MRVYGGGGGTITPEEIESLHRIGVARVFSPEDGRILGLEGMIATIVDECLEARVDREAEPAAGLDEVAAGRLRVDVDRTFALEDVAQAFAASQSGDVRGKLVIEVAD